MNSQPTVYNLEQFNQRTSVHHLLETLKKKVHNFSVVDKQGQLVGKVKTVILDRNQRLNLVISQQENLESLPTGEQAPMGDKYAFLSSQKIQRIDNINKIIFLTVDNHEIESLTEQFYHPHTINSAMQSENLTEISEDKIIRLLEEQLLVDSKIQKVGEVIVRKEIETQMVQVPVRREKLIVEQVSPEHKQLAEIDLGDGDIFGIELTETDSSMATNFASNLTVTGDFSSPKIASLLLNAIALEKNHGCQQVRVSILCADESRRQKYQEWFDRCSKGEKPKPEK